MTMPWLDHYVWQCTCVILPLAVIGTQYPPYRYCGLLGWAPHIHYLVHRGLRYAAIGCNRHPIPTLPLLWFIRMGAYYMLTIGLLTSIT